MGAQGDITQRVRDLALEAQKWNLFVQIKSHTDERVATEDFKAGQCEGVAPIGSIFVMVNHHRINLLEKAAGKKVVVLDWDPSMGKMISSIGAQPVPADLTTSTCA